MSRSSRVCLLALSVGCVLLSSSPGRPLWLDEVLHFAFGAYETTGEAWRVTRSSVTLINHGQTGAYIMVDYWLLRAFGASSFWLRFPSLLASIFLFLSALHLFEQWRLPFRWRIFGCLALFTQPLLMRFVPEARPYMVLAATSVGALGYYSTPRDDRRRFSVRILGVVSIVGGSLFHPYFPVYWLFACGFGYYHKVALRQEPVGRAAFLRHCNPLLSACGILGYFTLGYLTWMPHRPRFHFDPFETVRDPVQTMLRVHLGFLRTREVKALFLAIAGFTGIAMFLLPALRRHRRILLSPLLLMTSSLALSAALSYLSYRENYWILPRQWVASVALVGVASTWYGYALSTALNRKLALIWSVAVFGVVGLHSLSVAEKSVAKLSDALTHPGPAVRIAEPPSDLESPSPDDWIRLANLNCALGGPVWPIFRRFYEAYH